MEIELYIDVIFFTNFILDFLILQLTKKIRKKQTTIIRITFASIVGAVSGCIISIFPELPEIIKFFAIYIGTGVIMTKIAFTYKNKKVFLIDTAALFGLTFTIGGIANSLYMYTGIGYTYATSPLIILATITSITLFIKCTVQIYKRWNVECKHLYKTEIMCNGNRIKGMGFLDTGNKLREPISKKPVIIVEKSLFSDKIDELLFSNKIYKGHNLETKIRYIPYKSVGKNQGMLLGVVCEEVNIYLSNEECIANKNVIVAIYEGKLTTKNSYNIILHEELI